MKIIEFTSSITKELDNIIEDNNLNITCVHDTVCISNDDDAKKLQELAPEADYIVSDMTLEKFCELINDSQEWLLIFNSIIEDKDWIDETGSQYGICSDGEKRIEFDERGKARIVNV